MILRGNVWKFGNDIDTDVIIPIQHTRGTPSELGKHCMGGISPDFSEKVHPGDIIVAGRNFGCGSSREPAPIAIKAAGVSCVIAMSFARIFYRNAFNVGLPLLESQEIPADLKDGDELEVDLDSGNIMLLPSNKAFRANGIPLFMQELLRAGGLMDHVAKKLGLEVRGA
jgi:3-isopropylmalate dehydratase small subunit